MSGKRHKVARVILLGLIMCLAGTFLFGRAPDSTSLGLAYAASTPVDRVHFLYDEAWIDASGERQVHREIFDSVFNIIDEAEEFVLLDFFLVNDFLFEEGPGLVPLSQQLVDRLLEKRRANPGVRIVFITDPINTVYGSIASQPFEALEEAGIDMVWTDLDRLRDSNPIYSSPWRVWVRPFGLGPGDAMKNPMGEGRISARSMLKLLNFKANHRKLIVSEKSLLATTANPHSASSAHWNVALRFDGAGMPLALESEAAILRMSGAAASIISAPSDNSPEPNGEKRMELLTERRIREKAVELLSGAEPGARIDLGMFYLSHRDVLDALVSAHRRGCSIRVILDPNKDAFGRTKNGIPNRQTALRLDKAGIPLRWADTHGEQFHVKMLYVGQPGGRASLLLGSCNFTRRNMDDFNAECSVAFYAPASDPAMVRACETFERWWSNPDGRIHTVDYKVYADPSILRVVQAWIMERTGLSSF